MKRIKGKVNFDYDKDADVLYSYVNEPRFTETKELKNGIYLRIDSKTHKVVGFTIVDCLERIRQGLIKSIHYFNDIGLIDKYCK